MDTGKPTVPNSPSKLAPGLHLVATPIGNLGDLSPRALAALRDADIVLCEDTRITVRLLQSHCVRRKLQSYHEHNAGRVRPRIIERLALGASVALASDAGTPLLSDPGFKLVRDAVATGIEVRAIPGPSAALAALSVAGLPTDRFFFQGFLPDREMAQARVLAELAAIPASLVIFAAARRLAPTLAGMATVLGPRQAAVARELTKRFEEVRRGPLDQLAAHYSETGAPRGEIVIVVAPPEQSGLIDEEALDRALMQAMTSMSTSRAAAAVAAETGVPRKTAYQRALALKP